MNNLNSLIIEGNVAKKSILSEPSTGFKKCAFPVAVNRWYKNRDGEGVSEVSFFDVITYGKMAEYCEKNATKGRGIRVVGRLKQDRWQDKEGKWASKIYVVAEHIEYKPILDSSKDEKMESPSVENEEESEKESQEVVF
ncbi:MAG: single-stranded DNA-binding protein [Treponema sp.]|nr:single-stranded DNA-binding protein [Treponema sp.]